MDRRTIQTILRNGVISEPSKKHENQGICRTMVSPVVYEGKTVRALFKYYHDAESTEREGRYEMCARFVAQHFPFVELPVAALRPLPEFSRVPWGANDKKEREIIVAEGKLGGIQQFVTDAWVATNYDAHHPEGRYWGDDIEALGLEESPRFIRDVIAACLFDMVVYHPDKHEGNWLFRAAPKGKGKRHIVNIDHGLCFAYDWDKPETACCGAYHNYVKGKAIPEDMRAALMNLSVAAPRLARLGLHQEYCEALAKRAAGCAKLATI